MMAGIGGIGISLFPDRPAWGAPHAAARKGPLGACFATACEVFRRVCVVVVLKCTSVGVCCLCAEQYVCC